MESALSRTICVDILLSGTNKKLVEIGSYQVSSTVKPMSLTVTEHCLHQTDTHTAR